MSGPRKNNKVTYRTPGRGITLIRPEARGRFIFGLGVMGYWVLEEGVFGFFLLFLGQGWGVAVWGGGGVKIWIYYI
jgi:hypothetical protein